MQKHKVLSLLMALALCAGLLTVPSSAAAPGLTAEAETKLTQLLKSKGYTDENIQDELSYCDFTDGPQCFYNWDTSDTVWVNAKGEQVFQDLEEKYIINPFKDGYASIDQMDKEGPCTGYINAEGKIIIPCQYGRYYGAGDTLSGHVYNGRVWVLKENYSMDFQTWQPSEKTWEVAQLDLNGNVIVPWKTVEAYGETGMHMINDGRICADCEALELTAQPSTQTVTVDGKPVEFAMYALNDGGTNYIRVRDLASLLNGTAAQFEVGWNGSVLLTVKKPYTGSTDKAPFTTPMTYTVYTDPTYVNGDPVTLDAIQIEYNGGGFTYYKLRDLAQALGFNVGWSAEKGVFVETNKPYDPNN